MRLCVIMTISLVVLFSVNSNTTANAQVKPLTSAIIQVHGSPSPILLAPTRDADVSFLAKKGGMLKVRLDKLRDVNGNLIHSVNNTLQFEIVVNGGSPQTRETSFVIDHGQAKIETFLGLSQGDIVELRHLNIFDNNNMRFATLGVRIQHPAP
jgi:hypothetical protein